MDAWKEDFVQGLREGKPESYLAKSCAGMPLAFVQTLRDKDPEFAAMWDQAKVAQGRPAQRELTPTALEALLWAQCDDKIVAAYFGLTHKQFMDRVNSDDALFLVYETGRDAGKAALQRSQFEAAMDGDKTMLTWLGKQHLGQADKVEHKNTNVNDGNKPVTINNIFLKTLTTEQLEQLAAQAAGIGETIQLPEPLPVIDVQSEAE